MHTRTRRHAFSPPTKRPLEIAVIAILVVAAAALFLAYMVEGVDTGRIECKGTTGIYREYDTWTERYERYTVPNDPDCMNGSN